MKTEEYLHILTDQMRCKMVRDAVAEELRWHIEDQKAAYMSEGMESTEAEEAAVREMGDPVETGQEMDRIHRPKMPWGTIALIAVLSVIGIAAQQLVQAKVVEAGGDSWISPRWLLYLITSILVMTGICFVDYTRIALRARELMILLWLAMLAGQLFFGAMVNGVRQWIWAGVISINVPIMLLLTVPLYAAVLYRYRGEGYAAVGKAVLWMLPGLWLMISCPNVSMTVLLFFAYVAVLAAAVWKKWFRVSRKRTVTGLAVGVVMLPAAGCLCFWLFGTEYQRERLSVLLDPGSQVYGYMQTAVRTLIDGSRMVGANPDPETVTNVLMSDYVLTGVASYYGLLVAAVLAGLMLALFIWFIRGALGQKNQLGMLMGTGCSAVFLLQALFYVANNLGVVRPMVSYCPFFTYGGSGMIISYAMMGIILSIFRYQNTAPERKTYRRLFRPD